MQGPSISSAYQTIETAYTPLYNGRVCLPGGASDFLAVEGNYDEPTQAVGFAFWPSPPFTLSDGATITFVS